MATASQCTDLPNISGGRVGLKPREAQKSQGQDLSRRVKTCQDLPRTFGRP